MVRIPYALLVALRFSRGRRRSGMVSLIAIISTTGIALGVAVLIIGLSAMNGFERELNHRVLAAVPHGEIYPVNPPFQNWQQAIAQIRPLTGVVAAAPYISFTGLIEYGQELRAIKVRGVDSVSEAGVSALPQFVAGEAWQQFRANEQQIILGSGVATGLGVKVGEWVTLLVPHSDPEKQLLQPQRIRLQVRGILQLNGLLDRGLALIPLEDAQHYLFRDENEITGIALRFQNPFDATAMVRKAGEVSNNYVYLSSWISSYGYMYRDIQMIRAIMYLAMVLVISVASFNIVSTLVVAVKEKQSDIAILRTLGAKDSFIYQIFIYYGLVKGVAGALLGAVLGVVGALNLAEFGRLMERLLGHTLLSADIYPVNFLPSELKLMDVALVLLTALLLSLLASWYPARRASQLNPAHVLSNQ